MIFPRFGPNLWIWAVHAATGTANSALAGRQGPGCGRTLGSPHDTDRARPMRLDGTDPDALGRALRRAPESAPATRRLAAPNRLNGARKPTANEAETTPPHRQQPGPPPSRASSPLAASRMPPPTRSCHESTADLARHTNSLVCVGGSEDPRLHSKPDRAADALRSGPWRTGQSRPTTADVARHSGAWRPTARGSTEGEGTGNHRRPPSAQSSTRHALHPLREGDKTCTRRAIKGHPRCRGQSNRLTQRVFGPVVLRAPEGHATPPRSSALMPRNLV